MAGDQGCYLRREAPEEQSVDTLDDLSLLAGRVQQAVLVGDNGPFATLIPDLDSFVRLVHRGPPIEFDDLRQESLLALWSAFEKGKYDDLRAFGPWFCKLVDRVGIDLYHRVARWPQPLTDVESARLESRDVDIVSLLEDLGLDSTDRQLVVRRYVLGEKVEVIAREWRRCPGTIYRQLSRIRSTIQRAISEKQS
jgi:DNA-directed RNA polymerase specialized sigma24 family protein